MALVSKELDKLMDNVLVNRILVSGLPLGSLTVDAEDVQDIIYARFKDVSDIKRVLTQKGFTHVLIV